MNLVAISLGAKGQTESELVEFTNRPSMDVLKQHFPVDLYNITVILQLFPDFDWFLIISIWFLFSEHTPMEILPIPLDFHVKKCKCEREFPGKS